MVDTNHQVQQRLAHQNQLFWTQTPWPTPWTWKVKFNRWKKRFGKASEHEIWVFPIFIVDFPIENGDFP